MADFQEKLNSIAALRIRCRECEEELYRNSLRLYRSDQDLRRAEQRPTISDPNRERQVAAASAQIAELNIELDKLREEVRKLAEWFLELAEQRRLKDHLQTKLAAVQDRIASLKHEHDEPLPPHENIKPIEDELARLELIQTDISNSLRQANAALAQLLEREAEQSRKQDELQREMQRLREELRQRQNQLVDVMQPVFTNRDEVESRLTEFKRAGERLRSDCDDCEGQLHDAIVGLYDNFSPEEVVRSLDDRIPFLLFPVRLETIFVPLNTDGLTTGTELWVRVYPDDILVHTHEKTLTDREVVAGELYWTELLTAEHLQSEKDNRLRSAWRHIVEAFSGQRAAWIAQQTKPSDWDSLVAAAARKHLPEILESIDSQFFEKLLATDIGAQTQAELQQAIANNDGDALSRLAEKQKWFEVINAVIRTLITTFPEHDLTSTDSWTRAPRTYLLPDRFVLLLYQSASGTPREIIGNVIPDTMFLGPDPLNSEASFQKKADKSLTYGKSFDWMSNFDKAVEQGMGFRVRLNEAEALGGFVRVMVMGLFMSAKPEDSAKMLEELIDNHHYSPNGFSIVPQGTPTNNTEQNGTGYSDNDPYNDRAFFTAIDRPAFDPDDPDPKRSQTDARLLADALGLSYASLQTVQYADQTDVLEAHAMNRALFPITWGYWLRRWMSPAVDDEVARQARSFFTRFVSGRGPLPAIRVGNQPYGMLLTSDFSRWRYRVSDAGPITLNAGAQRELRFLENLYELLSALQEIWQANVNALPFVGKPGTDSADVLLQILALHPTSVEFFQRVGYSHEYLQNQSNFKDNGRFAGELNSHILGMPAIARSYLQSLGITRDDQTVRQMLSLRVLWQHYITHLDVPNLVENRPSSETNTLAVNYIDWLATADSTQKIINQEFPGTAPSALLFSMLRNALLLQLHNGAYEWLQERTVFEPVLEQATRATTVPEMRASLPSVSKFELMTTQVAFAEPTHPIPGMTVADLIWNGPTAAEVEAAFLKEQRAALSILVNSKTAELERCLIEHLDCCNYRLDAWQTGLFTQRLTSQRGSGPARRTGIYLGAFGWIDNLKPSVKQFLTSADIPTVLRPADQNPLLEEDDVLTSLNATTRVPGLRRAGFVHGPSLSHAAAAALLRNAYLSHAKPEQAEMFSVNLSSERVRHGQFILEGMRNGQPIEALLGYQFERGLHDRTSQSVARGDIPVLELNQFILPYRDAFRFESIEIAQAGTGGPSETVPAYSVVNGLKLAQASLSGANSFGLADFLAPADLPNSDQGAAIQSEQNRLLDTLDAVKDLLMAENAFQLAKGNFDRVAAVSLAQKEAHVPPELEVINTPRGTQFTFTNRVTLHFEDLDPSLASNNPWNPIPMSPRAAMEPGMNKWFASILPEPATVRCTVFWKENERDTVRHEELSVSLEDLGIQPIDLVWLINIGAPDAQSASELEVRIAQAYRRSQNIADEKIVVIEFSAVVAANETSFGQLFPLVRQFRAIISESRPLHALDFMPAPGGKDSGTGVDQDNPKGYDIADLRTRVQSSFNSLSTLADGLDGPTAPNIQITFVNNPGDHADDEIFVGQLGAALTKLEEKKLTFADSARVNVTFSIADAENLHRNLRSIASFGTADAFPPEVTLISDDAKLTLLARAHRIARTLRRSQPKDGVLERASDLMNAATTNKPIEEQVTLLMQAGRILFGENFNCLPKFTYHNAIDLAAADADRTQLLKFALTASPGITEEEVVDEWIQGLARVRRPLKRWVVVQTLADALGDNLLRFAPAQVPYRANDSWLAVEFPEKDPNNTDPNDPDKPFGISRDTISVAAHGAKAFQTGTRQSGVLLDDWTEEIPSAEETTGISFRFNQPNAAPPQSLLLVVTPEETGSWSWDELVGTLNDTYERAKRRAVEPSQLEQQGMAWNAFAPALVSEFSTLAQNDVSLDLMRMLDFAPLSQFYTTRS